MSLSTRSCAGTALENFLTLHTAQGLELSTWLNNLNTQNRYLEGSKSLAYQVLSRAGVSIPPSQTFSTLDQLRSLMQRPFPFVVKFDTSVMMGTQTVIVQCDDDKLTVWRSAEFAQSSKGIVQDFCIGKEYTVTVLVGKHNWISIGTAVDYKQLQEQNQGLNTWGLGSVSPCDYVSPHTNNAVDQVVKVLRKRFKYWGFLSCQFLLEPNGSLWFLEYNTRFCDPEFQSILPSLGPDLITAIQQLKQHSVIDPVTYQSVNAVTVGLIHQEWPVPQTQRANLTLDANPFDVVTMQGPWDYNTYWGTLTNSGSRSHAELVREIYNFLQTQDLGPYRYRTDIGQ